MPASGEHLSCSMSGVNKLRFHLDESFLLYEAKFPQQCVTQVTYVGRGQHATLF